MYVYFHSHQFFVHFQSWKKIILATFKTILSHSRCFLEPRKFLMGVCPLKPNPPAHWPLKCSLFHWLCLLLGSYLSFIPVFYATLFPAGFSDTHPGHNKTVWDLSAHPKKVMYWYPTVDKTITRVQKLTIVKIHNHFLFIVKNFYCVMVLKS